MQYIVDADIKGFFDHIDHDWMMKFLEWNIQDKNLLWLSNESDACKYIHASCADVVV